VRNKIKVTFMVKGIIIMLLACLYTPVFAQTEVDTDTLGVVSIETVQANQKTDFRVPDEEKIKEYQQDSRFQYKRVERKPSLWDEIQYRIARFISNLFGSAIQSGVPGVITIIIIVVIICLIILKLLGVDYRTVLGRKKIDTPEIDIYTENVHEMDFDTLISSALKNKDYRLAVRFLYLKNLKALSDKDIILWKANKTNYSYQHEINNSALRSKFLESTLIFDYIWYGEFNVDEEQYMEVSARMKKFNQMIADER